MNKQVIIYTDGACSGNPGPGGWGTILMYKDTKKEIKKELIGIYGRLAITPQKAISSHSILNYFEAIEKQRKKQKGYLLQRRKFYIMETKFQE